MLNTRFFGPCAVVLLIATATARADETYPIKCQRPVKIGDKFTVRSRVDQSGSARKEVNGAEVKKSSNQARFVLEGSLVITAVDDKGRETGLHLTLKKLEVSKEGTDAVAVLDPGTEIDIIYRDKKANFSRQQGSVSIDAKEALASIFSAPLSDKSDDDMFGAPDRKKIGESWPVNRKAMAEDAAGSGIEIDPEKISGKVTLVGTGKLGDLPSLNLKTDVDVTDLAVPDLGRAKVAHMQVSIEIELPVDVSNPSNEVTVTNIRHAIFEKEQGSEKQQITLDSKSTRNETRMLVK